MSTVPYVELAFNPTDLRARDIPTVGAFLGSPADAIEAGLAVARARMITQMKAEVRGIAEPSYGQLLQIADLAWQLFMPRYRKISAPVMADAYVRAYRHANAGDVPISVIYDLAEKHAEKTGDYFHASSRDALADGFNTLVNRRVPARAAADRVLDAYGLTPRQMRGYVNNKQLMTPVDSPIPFDVRGRAREYIDRSFTTRIHKLSEQEEHNIDEQAKQYAWMWMQDKGRLNERAQKIWITAKDEKVCPVCGPLHGQKVLVSEQFKTPQGDFWSPGVHPNCRCVVRLIENRFTLEKRYDIHQPRGKDGRWTPGQSQSRQLSHKVNALKSPSAKVHEGEVIHRSIQALGYVKEPRHILTPIKHRDREMAQLARGASAWSRRGANVQRTRKLAAEENQYYAGKMRMARTDKSLKKLITAVESAPSNSPELYRGMVVSPEHLKELKAGSSFQLPMSSFTESQPFSESFARKWGPMIAQAHAKREGKPKLGQMHPVVMVLEPKANALNISPIVSERQAEWITQGEFLITKVGDDKGLTVVHLKQTKHRVSKADDDDWDAELHPRGGDPENPGRFSRRPRPQPLLAAMAEPEEPEPEEEQQPEERTEPTPAPAPGWGRPSGGWGATAAPSQAWGGPAESQQQGWGAVAPAPAPAVAPTEATWGAPAQAQAPAQRPAPAPEPEPEPEPKPDKFPLLKADGEPVYRVVDPGEGDDLDFVLNNHEFTSKEEAQATAAQRRVSLVDAKFAEICPDGRSVTLKKYDPERGAFVEGWVSADVFHGMLHDYAQQARPYEEMSGKQVAHDMHEVSWNYMGHEVGPEAPELMSAKAIVEAMGIHRDDFVFQFQAATRGHPDPALTRVRSNGSLLLSGPYISNGPEANTMPDAFGKPTAVSFIEPR